jgi:hypothetical protein
MREKMQAALKRDGEEENSIKDLKKEVEFLKGDGGEKREFWRTATEKDVEEAKKDDPNSTLKVGASMKGMETRKEYGTRITGVVGDGEEVKNVREKRLAELLLAAEAAVENAELSAAAMQKARQAVENAKKALAEFELKKAEDLKRLFHDIAEEANEIQIEVNIDDAEFGEAFENIQKLSTMQDKEWERRRRMELKLAGVVEQAEADKIIAKEKGNREDQKNLTRQLQRSKIGTGTLQGAAAMGGEENQGERGEFQKARLGMFAKVFGDSRAKEELETINNRDFYRDKLAELGKQGFKGPEAVKLANTALDSKLMSEVGERQTTADSFRRIGAGGRAAVTDPMQQMAEKRNRILAAIEKDQKQLIKVMGGLPEKMPEAKVRG